VRQPQPGPLADERKERTSEDARPRNTAAAPDVLAGRLAGVDTRELQRRVRLNRHRQVRRAPEPDRPRAVCAAAREQLVREQPVRLHVAQPEEVEQEEVLRDHRRVRLELALPPAIRMLERQQPLGTALDGGVQPGELLNDGHTTTLVVTSDNTRAAVRPERTALSIVAGQPVAVHAPARVTLGREVNGPGRREAVPGRSATVA
jgi:hypothetical protein